MKAYNNGWVLHVSDDSKAQVATLNWQLDILTTNQLATVSMILFLIKHNTQSA